MGDRLIVTQRITQRLAPAHAFTSSGRPAATRCAATGDCVASAVDERKARVASTIP